MMNLCPLVADKLRSSGVMSTAAVRKLLNSIGISLLILMFLSAEHWVHGWQNKLGVCLDR